ncbi:MAG: putative toxin-antitoxin system toxin component, PIN family [Caldilineaceae bacterium]|nr:putative toxin-antitoxin system toxin component, PIN family [Caldilineaceae bacterium]
MHLVLDTNSVVSGLLWQGPQRRLLDLARNDILSLYTSLPLLLELDDVINRSKFAARLKVAGVSANELILGYAALATTVVPASIGQVVSADPDDDAVLACAVAAGADAIVSGDTHLLDLAAYASIPVLPAAILLDQLDL